jgi:hypothetical protein
MNQAYEFENIFHAKDVFARYFNHHNVKRRRHSLGRKSPLQYWNIRFHCHPVRPPAPKYGDLVKDDDTIKNQIKLSSLALSLTKSEYEVNLPGGDDKKGGKVLNLFEKSVQVIGG